jgi:fido (protein-threonine AMPylation protein)
MPGPVWGEDSPADEAVIAANTTTVLTAVVAAATLRRVPDLELAHDWHRTLYRGVASVPAPHYLGQVRGSDHPDLHDYEVGILDGHGRLHAGTAPVGYVEAELVRFFRSMRSAVTSLDAVIGPGDRPVDAPQLHSVLELAAIAHGEWIRIHPYANGNGRVGRTWANWVAVRYGLPPFVRIKPRPDGLLYGQAANASMGRPPSFTGDHRLTVQVFLDLLRTRP